MKNIIIILSIITALLVGFIIGTATKRPQVTIESFPKETLENQIIQETQPATQTESGSSMFDGEYFSFQYPSEYTLAEQEDGTVRITSIEPPEANEGECNALIDEQARGLCLDPVLSPDIVIQYSTTKDWVDMTSYMYESPVLQSSSGDWLQYSFAGEYGGRRVYGLPVQSDFITASYTHADYDSGTQFQKTINYQLDHADQRILIEDILSTLIVK